MGSGPAVSGSRGAGKLLWSPRVAAGPAVSGDAEFAEFYCPDNGRDSGKLLVRQLEIRGTGMNEVWAGTPVNTAAKLSGVAGLNEVAVSDRVFCRLRETARRLDEGRCYGAAAAEGMPAAKDWTWPLMKPSTFGNKTPFPGTWDWISTASTACGSHGVQLTELSFCEAIVTRQRGRA